jgi:hypothetical protein
MERGTFTRNSLAARLNEYFMNPFERPVSIYRILLHGRVRLHLGPSQFQSHEIGSLNWDDSQSIPRLFVINPNPATEMAIALNTTQTMDVYIAFV